MRYQSYVYLRGNSPDVEGIYLSSPEEPATIRQIAPNLKGVALEFERQAFQPLRIDHYAYLQALLSTFSLEEIQLGGRNRLQSLPLEIGQPTLKKLEIRGAPGFQELPNALRQAQQLRHLSLQSAEITWPAFLGELPDLQVVQLHSNRIQGLENVRSMPSLRILELNGDCGEFLPFALDAFPNLEILTIRNAPHLRELPSLGPLKALRELALVELPALKAFPEGWDSLQQLEKLFLGSIGTLGLEWPDYTCLSSLWEVRVEKLPLVTFPPHFGRMPQCQHLTLKNLTIRELPESLEHCSEITQVYLENLPRLTVFPAQLLKNNLKQLFIENCGIEQIGPALDRCNELESLTWRHAKVTNLPPEICFLPQLQRLELRQSPCLSELPDFDERSTSLTKIPLNDLPALESLPESWHRCPVLREVEMTETGVQEVPAAWATSTSLESIRLNRNPHLHYIPSVLATLPLTQLDIWNCLALPPEKEPLLKEIWRYQEKKKPGKAQWQALFFLLLDNHRFEAVTFELKNTLLELLHLPHTGIQQLVFDQLHLLNPDRRKGGEQLRKTNTSLAIAGTTKNAKTAIRSKVEDLGMQYHTTVRSDTTYLVVGTKAVLPPETLSEPHIFLSEAELDQWLTQEKPDFLREADENTVLNLRRLLWSNEKANDALVWEMIKNGGVPDELIPDLMVVAKTGEEASVRQALRKFLKGKLGLPEQQVLADRTNLFFRCPYDAFRKMAPDFDVAQFALTHYRRSGKFLRDFFRTPSVGNPYRGEVFAEIRSTFLAKPHYLQLGGFHLTTAELNSLLADPVFEGRLERLAVHSYHLTAFPEALFRHQQLKDLTFDFLSNPPLTGLPEALWELKKLKRLSLSIDNLESLPEAFGNLSQLSEVLLYTQKPIRVPDTVRQLTKLQRFYCSGGVANYQEYAAFLPR